MKIFCFISCVFAFSLSYAGELDLLILPTSDLNPNSESSQELDAYFAASLNHPNSQWNYHKLPPQATKCRDLDCYLSVISDQKEAKNPLLLVPKLDQAGSFNTLEMKLVESHTWRILQVKTMHWRTFEPIEIEDIKNVLSEMADLHLNAQSQEEEFYQSQDKSSSSVFGEIFNFWPMLLFTPIVLLYL